MKHFKISCPRGKWQKTIVWPKPSKTGRAVPIKSDVDDPCFWEEACFLLNEGLCKGPIIEEVKGA